MVIDKTLYPFTGRRIDLGGVAMHYLDEGKGETVLMVHGNPTWSFYFREVVKALSPTHRCIVPDHIGMGLSDRPADKRYAYTLKRRVDDLDALMERVAPTGPVTLIVHDWGGMIAMSWAVRHPERIKAIVALNTSCFRLPAEKKFPKGLEIMRGALTGIPLRALGFARSVVLRTCTAKKTLSPEERAGYLEPYDGWTASRAVHRFVQDIPLAPGDPAWDVVVDTESKVGAFKDVPMLLPWGLKDWVFDEAFLNGWIERFPKATVKRFPDCGHFLLEDAGEEVVALIKDFVARPVPA
ncbi:MAG: alpha/beta fold hydrolase [Elusimicrobia bacterium]|nr:alpha/beta fold hydrolase [Elusimicrobiota bacterium]